MRLGNFVCRILSILVYQLQVYASNFNGCIDWQKTINRIHPIFSNGSPIYQFPLCKKNNADRNNVIISIQKYCLYESINKYGWLLNAEFNMIPLLNSNLPYNISKCIHLLKNELRVTFIEREINVIKWLIAFLECQSNCGVFSNKIFLFTKTFYTVWEKICSTIFENQYNSMKQSFPQPKWNLIKSARSFQVSQRPDILLFINSSLFVLDAKYYDVTKNLLGWHDSVKQFFYALSSKYQTSSYTENGGYSLSDILLNTDSVYNAFILPSFDSIPISNIGFINVPSIPIFGTVEAYTIDVQMAMKCYLGWEKFNYRLALYNDLLC